VLAGQIISFMQATKFLFLARVEEPNFFLEPNPRKK
jgi:hypothetical protein